MLSPDESPAKYHIAAIERAVAVLTLLEQRSGLRMSEIARDIGLSEPTTVRYLSNLVEHGLVERDAAGSYSLGLRLFQLGQRAVGHRDVRKLALPELERLHERFEETVNLALRRDDDVVIIDVVESRRSIRKGASLGEPDSWHCSALGKAILSRLPEREVRTILARCGTESRTEKTLATVDAVLRDLVEIRARGFSIDDEEAEPGLRCVAAAVCDRHGDPVYAISVSGPASRVTPQATPEMGAAVASAADAVSAALGYQDEAAAVDAAGV